MISINLIRGGAPVSGKGAFQVLCKVPLRPLRPPFVVSFAGLPPSLHPRLMERLLGKCPLQLVVERVKVEKGVWKEKLSCGHEVTTFQEFLWDDRSALVEVEITAKRRRCPKCKPAVAPVLKTRAEITADQARAALIHERKLKFGTLFEKLCFENGEMRPGELSKEAVWTGPISDSTKINKSSTKTAISASAEIHASLVLPKLTNISANTTSAPASSLTNGTAKPIPEASPVPSPKKPVESVGRIEKEDAA
jgi:hypothetical protein